MQNETIFRTPDIPKIRRRKSLPNKSSSLDAKDEQKSLVSPIPNASRIAFELRQAVCRSLNVRIRQ